VWELEVEERHVDTDVVFGLQFEGLKNVCNVKVFDLLVVCVSDVSGKEISLPLHPPPHYIPLRLPLMSSSAKDSHPKILPLVTPPVEIIRNGSKANKIPQRK